MEIYRLLVAVAAFGGGMYLARRADFPGLLPLQRFAVALVGTGLIYLVITLSGLSIVVADLGSQYPDPDRNTFVDVLRTLAVLGALGYGIWALAGHSGREEVSTNG